VRRANRLLARNELRQHFVVLGEARFRMRSLVPKLFAIHRDEEVAFAAGLLLNFGVGVSRFDGGGQTGRRWQVVSSDAVFDQDVHRVSLDQGQLRFRDAIARAVQPARNSTPPIGVIGPNHCALSRTSP
jgi:hypothetical protein